MSLVDKIKATLNWGRFNQPTRKRAMSLQDAGRWKDAVSTWEQIAPIAPNDHLSQLNFTICLYQVGRFEEAAAESLRLIELLPVMLAYSCAVIALLSSQRIGNARVSADLARTINEHIESLWDLPGVPTYAELSAPESEHSCPIVMESKNLALIIDSLESLSRANLDAQEHQAVISLLTRYQQKQAI